MERKMIKSDARRQIKGNVGKLFVIGILSSLISFALLCIPMVGPIVNMFISSALSLATISIYIGISNRKNPKIADLFNQIKNCFLAFWATFLVSVYTFLWSLLLIVPGIIKSCAYSQTMYILAENPEIGASEAVKQSKAMMNGHKMEYFLLQLSFIGWGVLGVFTLGLLYIWLIPYMMATYANFYMHLKQECVKDTSIKPIEENARMLESVTSSTKSQTEQEAQGLVGAFSQVAEQKSTEKSSPCIPKKTMPVSVESCPSSMTPQDAMVATLRKHGELSLEALKRECPAVRELSDSRISALLTQDSRVGSSYRVRTRFYFTLPERDPKDIEQENERYMNAILEYVQQNGGRTVAEIADNCMAVMSLPTQRVSELTRNLTREGKLRRVERGGKNYYEWPTVQNRPATVQTRPATVRAGSAENTLQSLEAFLARASDTRLLAIAEENMLDLLHVSGISSAQEFFKVQVLAARIGFEARNQLSEKQKHFATANLSKFYKGPMDDILPMLTGEITEPEYQAIESICLAGREKTTIPLLTYILCFAYSDGKPSTSLEEKLVAIIRRINPKGMKAMASIKCKICGGTIEINNENVAVCEFCGATQTVPRSNNTYEAK